MEVTIGNTCSEAGGSYQWQIFLRASDPSLVRSVGYVLHPTFAERRGQLAWNSGAGEFSSGYFSGWGTFAVPMTIALSDGRSVVLNHTLSFDAAETSSTHAIECVRERPMDIDTSAPHNPENDLPAERTKVLALLKRAPKASPQTETFMAGRLFQDGSVEQPRVAWKSHEKPRADHGGPEWLTATEYRDAPDTAALKASALGNLLRLSKHTVVYSGAGISVAAGIGQAARGSGTGNLGVDAQPTYTHYALGRLAAIGMVHEWIQQNHDGLPQKAGFPQESINEIHGSWFDPSNPVVLYSGQLKGDCFPWMRRAAGKADLVLVLGTSLSGLNADQVAVKPAERSINGESLGTVIINLQQTPHDGLATLRVFDKSDTVFERVLRGFGVTDLPMQPFLFSPANRVPVPYDARGKRSDTVKTWLDLSPGAAVRITEGHNIQGAGQPAYLHIGAKAPVTHRGVTRPPGKGFGKVVSRDDTLCAFNVQIDGVVMLLGTWWLDAAQRGGPATLPVVNVAPELLS